VNARQGDIISGLCVLAFAGLILWESEKMPSGPAGFPQLIAIGLLIFGGILLIRALISKKDVVLIFQGINWKVLLTTLGAWLVVVIFIAKVGFFALSGVFLAVMAWYLRGRPKDFRSLAEIGAFALGMGVGLWVTFTIVLDREYPSGFLF
jgi:hypothetical protein